MQVHASGTHSGCLSFSQDCDALKTVFALHMALHCGGVGPCFFLTIFEWHIFSKI